MIVHDSLFVLLLKGLCYCALIEGIPPCSLSKINL